MLEYPIISRQRGFLLTKILRFSGIILKTAADEVITLVVQVNGKLRDRLEVSVDAEKDDVLAQARAAENAGRYLEGKQVVKEIFVPGKLVNFVVR